MDLDYTASSRMNALELQLFNVYARDGLRDTQLFIMNQRIEVITREVVESQGRIRDVEAEVRGLKELIMERNNGRPGSSMAPLANGEVIGTVDYPTSSASPTSGSDSDTPPALQLEVGLDLSTKTQSVVEVNEDSWPALRMGALLGLPGCSFALNKAVVDVNAAVPISEPDTKVKIGPVPAKRIRKATAKKLGAALVRIAPTKKHKKSASGVPVPDDSMDLYSCGLCNKMYGSTEELSLHLVSHHDLQNPRCLICKVNFDSESLLTEHLEGHSLVKPQRLYRCDVCCRGFKSATNRKVHAVVHAREEQMLGCGHCSKKFLYQWHLKKHEETHKDKAKAAGSPTQ